MMSFAEIWRFADQRTGRLPHARKGRRAPDIPTPEGGGFTAIFGKGETASPDGLGS